MKKFNVKKQVKQEKQPTYTVFDNKRGKTFATENEAIGYTEEYRRKTGIFLGVYETKRTVTHIFSPAKK